jgi:hypothetical protein
MTTKLGSALGVIAAGLFAGVATLQVAGRAADAPVAPVSIDVAPTRIEFRAGKAVVADYNIGPAVAKPYFWPLNAPGGQALTRGWPMDAAGPLDEKDHIHQKSAWFCHGDVLPEGLELKQKLKGVAGVDFWSEFPGAGRIVCTKVGEASQEKNHGQVATFNEWRTADGQKVLDEKRVIHLYNFGDAQLLVIDSDLNASVAPLIFGDTKEGSFGVRVRGSLTEKKGMGTLSNAEGKQKEKEVWGQTSAWCDYSGPVSDTATAGITIFADPSNRFATAWHSRGYGLMAANPFGRNKSGFPAMKGKTDLVRLEKGEHLKLRYGLLLHMGDAREGKVAEFYDRFTKLKG